MIRKRIWLLVALPVALSLILVAGTKLNQANAGANDRIATNIALTGFLQSLEDALDGTDVESELGSSGSYVMFAPTNSGFVALPEGLIATLRAEPGLGTMNYLLSYHVVESETLAITSFGEVSGALNGTYVTLNGVPVAISADPTLGRESLFVNDVEVIGFIPSSNGSIWLTGSVLVPPGIDLLDPQVIVTLEPTPTPTDAPAEPTPTTAPGQPTATPQPATTATAPPATGGSTIGDIVVSADNLSTLETAIGQALLSDELNFGGPFTVFAPTNAAFAALTPEQQAALAADPLAVLQYHVIPGELTGANLVSSGTVPTLLGNAIQVDAINQQIVLNNTSRVITADIQASNGVIHVVDQVLFPPSIPVPQPEIDVSQDSANSDGLILSRTTYSRSEEIVAQIPRYGFAAGVNGSYRMQIFQYPNGLENAPILYKDAQHWDSSGSYFVFGSLNNALVDVPSVFVITPHTYELVFGASPAISEYIYTIVDGAPVSRSEPFTFTP